MSEDRLDRVERILEGLSERQEASAGRMERTEANIELLIETVDRAIAKLAEQSALTESRLIDLTQQIAASDRKFEYLVAQMQAHMGQASPPAHEGGE